MALPNRLWLPEGAGELPTFFPETTRVAVEVPLGQRWRRRAVLAGIEGQPERTVLVEWFSASDLQPAQLEPLRGLCHVNLLRLLQCGQSDGRTAYAISEAPLGLDLASIVRTAQVKLPAWWAVAVVAEAARGLLALQQFWVSRGPARGHGAVDGSCVFVSASGRVQVLAFAPLVKVALGDDPIAPEVRWSTRLATTAADVYSLCSLLLSLPVARPLPDELVRLCRRGLSPYAEKRPTLRLLYESLCAAQTGLAAPLSLSEQLGSELSRLLPPTRSRELSESDWGSAGPVSFGPLPKTLFPLSSSAVSLSATWDAAPPIALSPPSRRPWLIGSGLLLLTLLGGLVGWRLRSEPERPAARPVATPILQPSPSSRSQPSPLPSLLPDTLLLKSGERGRLGGLRTQLLRSEQRSDGVHLTLLLVNAAQRPQPLDPMSLRLSATPDSQAFAPEPSPPLVVMPGQMQTIELRFAVPEFLPESTRLWQVP